MKEQKDKSWKLVKQDPNNADQYLLGYFNSEQHAKDNIPFMMQKYGNWIKNKESIVVKRVNPEMILNPVVTDYMHYVWSLIPKDDKERVMRSDASAEIDANNHMCGGATYYNLSKMIPKDWTVIDIGCAYNPQSYLFQNHARHIAVEPEWLDSDFCFEHFKAQNTELLFMTGQAFIKKELPKLNLDLSKTFCILNFVPSDEVNVLVRQSFRNLYVFYPA
jgi:hypothetical protein